MLKIAFSIWSFIKNMLQLAWSIMSFIIELKLENPQIRTVTKKMEASKSIGEEVWLNTATKKKNIYGNRSLQFIHNNDDKCSRLSLGGSETVALCSIICFLGSDNSKLIICYYVCGRPEIKASNVGGATSCSKWPNFPRGVTMDGWVEEETIALTQPINKELFNLVSKREKLG